MRGSGPTRYHPGQDHVHRRTTTVAAPCDGPRPERTTRGDFPRPVQRTPHDRMSIRAVLWALEIAKVPDPTTALLLVALCERANDDGRGSWPTMEWLADAARIDRSNVKRHLRKLQRTGLIAPLEVCNDPRWLRLRADRRPRVWAIAVPGMPAPGGLSKAVDNSVINPSRGGAGAPSSDADGGAPVHARGGAGAPNGGAPVPPRHIKEEPEENRNREPQRASAPENDTTPAAESGMADVIDLRGAAAARAALRDAQAQR